MFDSIFDRMIASFESLGITAMRSYPDSPIEAERAVCISLGTLKNEGLYGTAEYSLELLLYDESADMGLIMLALYYVLGGLEDLNICSLELGQADYDSDVGLFARSCIISLRETETDYYLNGELLKGVISAQEKELKKTLPIFSFGESAAVKMSEAERGYEIELRLLRPFDAEIPEAEDFELRAIRTEESLVYSPCRIRSMSTDSKGLCSLLITAAAREVLP